MQLNLLAWGALPNLLVIVITSLIFLVLGVIIFVDKRPTPLRINVYAVLVIAALLLLALGTYVVEPYHSGSDEVRGSLYSYNIHPSSTSTYVRMYINLYWKNKIDL